MAIKTFYVYVVFLLCYCPYLIVLTVLFVSHARLSTTMKGAVQLTTVLMMLNSSLNPLVFGWKMREVRQNVKNYFKSYFFHKSDEAFFRVARSADKHQKIATTPA